MDTRISPIAGTWYPGHADALRSMIDHCLKDEPTQHYETLYGLLVPHAGLRYSGLVAGYSFHHLRNRSYKIVVVIGPSHYPYPAALLSTAHEAYQTPLGTIPV